MAFSVLLILILLGLYQGFQRAAVAYIDSIPADIWVSQKGAGDMFHTVSLIPNSVEAQLRALPEVSEGNRLLFRQVAFDLKGREVHTRVVGYDPERDIGGPIAIHHGAAEPKRGQIIVDKVFAQQEKLTVGDKVEILDRDFEVAGISDKGNLMISQYSFVTQTDLEEMVRMKETANFFLVSLNDAGEIDRAVQNIDNLGGLEARKKADFAIVNGAFINDTFLPIIAVLILIGFGVGVTVIGLTIYNATVEKSREYGVLKALGATNGQLYRVVFEQSIISGTAGYLVGAPLSLLVGYTVQNFVPSFVFATSPAALVGVFGAAILMSIAASYIPTRHLLRIDPAMVFKS